MKRLILLFSAIMLLTMAEAQVGVNNPTPHVSSVLDLSGSGNETRGILLPATTNLIGVVSPRANGLMLFDETDSTFKFWQGGASGAWQRMNPWQSESGTAVTSTKLAVGIGVTNPVMALEVDGSASFTGNVQVDTLKADAIEIPGFSSNAFVPTGVIVMWSGTTPPDGWALCDGTNGTPNLAGRFIVGYSSSVTDYNNPGNRSEGGSTAGNTGGLDEVTLTESEMPAHDHSGTTSMEGEHTHDIEIRSPIGKNRVPEIIVEGEGEPITTKTDAISLEGDHTHTFTTDSKGGGQPHENRPPYYTLAYIIKL